MTALLEYTDISRAYFILVSNLEKKIHVVKLPIPDFISENMRIIGEEKGVARRNFKSIMCSSLLQICDLQSSSEATALKMKAVSFKC